MNVTREKCYEKRTNRSPGPGNSGVVLLTNQLVLAEDARPDTLNDTDLGVLLVLQLAQAEGEHAELLLHLAENLAGCRTLEGLLQRSTAVQGSPLLELLNLAGSQAHTHLDTPDLANLGQAVALGAITRSEHNLLLVLNFVAAKEPGGGTLDNVDLVALGNLLNQSVDLALCLGLGGSGLYLLLVGASSQHSRGQHQSQKQLVGVVSGQEQVGSAALNHILGFVLGGDNDGVAHNRSKAIDLCAKLDLDNLALLKLNSSLLLVRLQWGVGSDIGAGRNGRRVSET